MWDEGLQPERTSLSWLRTALGVTAVSLLLARVTMTVSMWLAAMALVTAAGSGFVAYASHRANERRLALLRRGGSVVFAGGPVVVTLAVTVLAVIALVFLW